MGKGKEIWNSFCSSLIIVIIKTGVIKLLFASVERVGKKKRKKKRKINFVYDAIGNPNPVAVSSPAVQISFVILCK